MSNARPHPPPLRQPAPDHLARLTAPRRGAIVQAAPTPWRRRSYPFRSSRPISFRRAAYDSPFRRMMTMTPSSKSIAAELSAPSSYRPMITASISSRYCIASRQCLSDSARRSSPVTGLIAGRSSGHFGGGLRPSSKNDRISLSIWLSLCGDQSDAGMQPPIARTATSS